MIKYYNPENPEIVFYLAGNPADVCRIHGVVAKEVPALPQDVDKYLINYFQASKALLRLAGRTVSDTEWPKLEDQDYLQVLIAAMTSDFPQASLAKDTLMYSFFQLKLLGMRWEQFEYPLYGG